MTQPLHRTPGVREDLTAEPPALHSPASGSPVDPKTQSRVESESGVQTETVQPRANPLPPPAAEATGTARPHSFVAEVPRRVGRVGIGRSRGLRPRPGLCTPDTTHVCRGCTPAPSAFRALPRTIPACGTLSAAHTSIHTDASVMSDEGLSPTSGQCAPVLLLHKAQRG